MLSGVGVPAAPGRGRACLPWAPQGHLLPALQGHQPGHIHVLLYCISPSLAHLRHRKTHFTKVTNERHMNSLCHTLLHRLVRAGNRATLETPSYPRKMPLGLLPDPPLLFLPWKLLEINLAASVESAQGILCDGEIVSGIIKGRVYRENPAKTHTTRIRQLFHSWHLSAPVPPACKNHLCLQHKVPHHYTSKGRDRLHSSAPAPIGDMGSSFSTTLDQ